jgi:AcrR family transcriptional regulator
MNVELAAGSQPSRATIMAELASVLRNSNGSTTSIESAIARTGVSLQEISVHFGGKRELLLAMISELSDSMSDPLTRGSTDPDSTKVDFQQRLLDFGQSVTDIYATSHLRDLYRIAITESIRHTGLGRDFYEAGPGRLTQRLAEFLETAQADGTLGSADPHLLASHFLASLRTNLDVADTFSHGLATSTVADRTYVRNVVDLFLNGICGGRQPC